MIVKFKNVFQAAGFPRNRFPKGVVMDVPDTIKKLLPKSAKILKNYKPEEQVKDEEDERRANDLLRSVAESIPIGQVSDEEALKQAGLSGLEDINLPGKTLSLKK